MRTALGAPLAALSLLAAGCGASIPERIHTGGVNDAWDAACEATYEEGADPLTQDDHAALRKKLLARTRIALSARVKTPEQIAATMGEPVFKPGALLVMWRLDALDYPGTSVMFEPRVAASAAPLAVWHDRNVWALAGVTPPVSASHDPNYNALGALVDGFVTLATAGVVQPKLRGTDAWLPEQVSPGSPGTGTPVQTEVLALLEALDASSCEAKVGEPCEGVFAMGPGAAPERHMLGPGGQGGPVFLGSDAASGDALVVRVVHKRSSSESENLCDLGYDVALPLAPGASLAERLGALFARGPVILGGAALPGSASK